MTRGVGGFVLRLAVAVGGLALVIRLALPPTDGDGGLIERLRTAWIADPAVAWAWVGLAAVLFFVSYAVGALRFQLVHLQFLLIDLFAENAK